jgi:hypothetical protein
MVSIWLTKVKGAWRKFNMKKIGFAKRSRFWSNATGLWGRLLPVLLDAGGAQPGKAMLINGKLPGKEFVDRQRVAAASLLEGEQAAADRGNDFGLTANNPPFGPGRGQIRNC